MTQRLAYRLWRGPGHLLPTPADLWSGLVAAAIVLPQSMAFGTTLASLYLPEAASGALAGLLTAAILGIVTGIAGGTVGMVSAPSGPVLVMLAAIGALLERGGLHGAEVMAALGVVIALAGIMQVAIGRSGSGRLVKYIPVPVVAGFITGSGILMILSQVRILAHGDGGGGLMSSHWLALLVTVFTVVAIRLLQHRWPRFPAILGGLLAGLALHHLLARALAIEPAADWMVGALPALDMDMLATRWMDPARLPWPTVFFAAALLALLCSLDTLKTSVIADSITGERHDSRQELTGQGVAHVVSGLAGGIAGSGTIGATAAALHSGGRRVALVYGTVIAVVLVLFGSLTAWIPVSVLAGIIIHVGLSLASTNIIDWWQRRRTRTEALIALLVTVITVAYDLILAVVAGVAITAAQILAAQVRMPVILRRVNGRNVRSLRVRPDHERESLDAMGERIVMVELRGPIIFATGETLYEEMAEDLDRGRWIVLSLRRVTQVDLTGMKLLQQMAKRAARNGGEIVFANVHKRTGMGRKVHKTFRKAGFDISDLRLRTFSSSDTAMEYCEDMALRAAGIEPVEREVPLAASELCRGMTEEQSATLAGYVVPLCIPAKTPVYVQGEYGDCLYVVISGNVDIRLTTSRKHYSRLGRMGPGMVFGEVSFNTPGAHTATAFATVRCELVSLSREDFARLSTRHPDIALTILSRLGANLGSRLRQANREIYRLNRF